jgi:hypothetical protein
MALSFLFPAYSELLVMIDNYHLSRENASFHLIIWHQHLWGGRF